MISGSPTDAQPVFDTIVRSAVRLCGAIDGVVYRLKGGMIHSVAHHNFPPEQLEHWRRIFPRFPRSGGDLEQVMATRTILRMGDLEAETVLADAEMAANRRARGARSLLIVPMLRHDQVIGAIGVSHRRVNAFSDAHVQLLKTFADQAVIAIENARLFTELEEKNSALTESLEQQTATSEILRAISNSPTDAQPVFETIVRNAVRLCGGIYGGINRRDGDQIHLAAHYNFTSEQLEQWQRTFPRPLWGADSPATRVIRTGAVYRSGDVEAESDPEISPEVRAGWRARGVRSLLIVPMFRRDEVIGSINVVQILRLGRSRHTLGLSLQDLGSSGRSMAS